MRSEQTKVAVATVGDSWDDDSMLPNGGTVNAPAPTGATQSLVSKAAAFGLIALGLYMMVTGD